MKSTPKWISKKALLLLHEESLAWFGGRRGIQDEGWLESALARPRNRQVYATSGTLADLAASYAFGLVKNHPFVDGNKRAGFLSIGLFLLIHGRNLVADKVEAVRIMLRLAAGEIDETALSRWITKNSVRGEGSRRRG